MPFLLALLLTVNLTPSVLTVPILDTPDAKSVWIDALHQCENQNDRPRILDSNNKYSYGFVMFQMDTWLEFGKKFGATRDNISDDDLQETVARDMLDHGLWRHWYNCGKLVTKKLGAYP